MKEDKKSKCYGCRKQIKKGKLFCKDCENKPEARKSGVSTLIIYNKI